MELNENKKCLWHRDQCKETDEKILNEEPLTSSLIEKDYKGFPLNEMDRLRQKRSKSPISPVQKIEQICMIHPHTSQPRNFDELHTKQRSSTFGNCYKDLPQRKLRAFNNDYAYWLLEENNLLRKQLEKKEENIAQLRLELAKQKHKSNPINNENLEMKQYKHTLNNKEKSKTLNVTRSSQLMKKLSFKRSLTPMGITPSYQLNREESGEFKFNDEQYELENEKKGKDFWSRQKPKWDLKRGKTVVVGMCADTDGEVLDNNYKPIHFKFA